MVNTSSLTALMGTMALVVAQSPNKPVISPGFDFGGRFETDLRNNLSPTQSTNDDWGAGWIPQSCKDYANKNSLSPYDFQVFNVHYTDCGDSWVMCRHKDSPVSKISMIDIFGRMPLGMRELIRHVMAVPDVHDGVLASSTQDDITVRGTYFDVSIFAHEMSHTLDSHGPPGGPMAFSSSSIWKDNYNQDSASVSAYGQTSWAENFAEVGRVALYDKVVPGGVGGIQPNWQQIFHQYATYQGYYGDTIIPRAKPTCTKRTANTAPVTMGNSISAKFVSTSPPDVSFTSGVEVVPEGAFHNITFITRVDA